MIEELLEILRADVNRRGLAVVSEERLTDALRCTPKELSVAVQSLADRKAIAVLSPLPYLVARVESPWAGSRKRSASSSGESAQAYSYADSSIHKTAMQLEQDSHSAGSDDEVLREILSTLGETDPDSFRGLLDHYPRAVIHRALDRVRVARNIQKSRTALFRYLLPRLALSLRSKP